MNFIFVALGGALGACLRYSISMIPFRGSFPVLTLITNILGALIIGFIAGYAKSRDVSRNTMLFIKTGICGGFTTFSTFSLEAYELLDKGQTALAVLYAALSVIGCVAGVWVGMMTAKTVI
ncbi:MAG: fluoride efflux transporter CrcB [Ruminococcus sp.]|nr:fluoride efflux transporter CrcB [Ruminococcus sp.]